ncbi:PIG-M-domain-containing protein [Auriculariales sp. MPI-PUGE-AT-0066]|nr:PIG-M-domain-containing protein [Auriculariales sp. MPI-PUGE-AT-0066]
MLTSALSWRNLFTAAFILRIALVAYSEYHDSLPTTKVKYTDVDYRVFSDAAKFLWNPRRDLLGGAREDNVAKGPLGSLVGLGDPYERPTYRYTPLLALLLIPNEIMNPAFGKVLFVIADMVAALLLRRIAKLTNISNSNANAYIALSWLFNPLVFSISTRGSSESILGVLVLAVLHSALSHKSSDGKTAFLLALAVHFKIYPFIYGAAFLSLLSAPGWLSARAVRFAVMSLCWLAVLTLPFYLVWGQAFLQHAYLYHIGRLDHRHNFSPYFYPTYLSYPALDTPRPGASLALLFSFLPQLGLSGIAGLLLGRRRENLPFAFFVQTVIFVTFNKVCTSQYFLWYMWFLPLVLPRLHLERWEKIALPSVWVAAQALWLSIAYGLEFERRQVFLPLWVASMVFLVANGWLLSRMLRAYARGAEPSSREPTRAY